MWPGSHTVGPGTQQRPLPGSLMSLPPRTPSALRLAEASSGLCEKRNQTWLPKIRSKGQCRSLQDTDVTPMTWFRRH